ncbi:hypothetical protein Dimus_032139 [Dionaea muscipula]
MQYRLQMLTIRWWEENEENVEADQVLGSSVMHNDVGELMTDGHERDDSKKGKKTRGRTMKAGIHALTEKDQKAIIMNANFQPIGPDEQTMIDFVEFLGTLSRTSSICPLTVDKWTDMNKVYKDAKEKMWDYVKKRWVIPNGAKKWVLRTIGVLWRNFKNKLKRDHYTPYETTKMRWKNRPEDVSDEDFKFLLKKWKDLKYKTRMEELQSQQSEKSSEDAESNCSVDPFLAIMGKELAPIYYAHLAATQIGQWVKFEDTSETSSSHGGVTASLTQR